MAEARAETMKQEREVYAALQYAAGFHCCLVEEWKDCEELKPKAGQQKVESEQGDGRMDDERES